jgi:hypothetical protein
MNREAYRPPHLYCHPTGRDLHVTPPPKAVDLREEQGSGALRRNCIQS